ncbi:MAG TPA: DUF481 domain-containing protein [Longimicrobiales bacterium]|nr:DUF481 domain-containing protein [Longimicrobiales bacterium]
MRWWTGFGIVWPDRGRAAVLAGAVFLCGVGSVAVRPLEAQESSPDSVAWELGGELGASLFYGSSEQYSFTARTRADYEHAGLALETRAGFDYGEASEEGRERFVSSRSWNAKVSVDYDGGVWAPFVEIGSRGSLQRRLDHRTSVGGGTRYRLVRGDDANVDLSVSLAAEFTDPRVEPGEPETPETKGRWSGLFRAERSFGEDRMTLGLSSEYEPALGNARRDYVVDTSARLSYALTTTVDFELVFENTYDAQADDRGAASNSDGRVFFMIGASVG